MAAQTIRAILRHHQWEAYQELKRFNIIVSHRRWGKTYLAILWLLHEVWNEPRKNARGHYYASSYQAAKRIAWQYIKDFTQAFDGVQYNESELRVNWADKQIQLGSAENPDSSRGIYSDAVCMDEVAMMPTRMYTEVLRPAIADREGSMLMIGTPMGRHGLFYESWQNAQTDPDWSTHMYKASQTGIIPDKELEAMRKAMSRAEYEQELEVSFDALIRGSYWGETVTQIEADGHLRTISHDPERQVHCSFDLGVNDATAIWFFQLSGNEYHFIDYQEFTNTGLPDIVKWLRDKPYTYGKMVFPHDVRVTSLSTGQTREHTLQQLGIEVVVAPKLPVIDGIDTARSRLQRCYFDPDQCRDGIEALRQYRSDWDDKKGVLRLAPLHDWASHGADSFRYLCSVDHNMLQGGWGEIDYTAMDRGIVGAY